MRETRTVFIRGTFALCKGCGADLHVKKNVVAVEPYGNGVLYRTHCDNCHRKDEIVMSRETHSQSVNYLKEVALDKARADSIIVPLSDDEELLKLWHDTLDQTGDEDILARLKEA